VIREALPARCTPCSAIQAGQWERFCATGTRLDVKEYWTSDRAPQLCQKAEGDHHRREHRKMCGSPGIIYRGTGRRLGKRHEPLLHSDAAPGPDLDGVALYGPTGERTRDEVQSRPDRLRDFDLKERRSEAA